MKIQNLVLVAGLTAVAVYVSYDYFTNSPPQSGPARVASSLSGPVPVTPQAQTFGPAAQTSNEGQVEVTVTPGDLSGNAKTWDFTVSLNTHSVELAEDLAQSAVLDDGQGNWIKPIVWNGDPPGGHHREGVLSFEPVSPRPSTIKLEIRGVGGVEVRTFEWQL